MLFSVLGAFCRELARPDYECERRLPKYHAVALQDPWGRVQWLWDRPPLKRLRLTISMAQWSVRLPALLALIATQV